MFDLALAVTLAAALAAVIGAPIAILLPALLPAVIDVPEPTWEPAPVAVALDATAYRGAAWSATSCRPCVSALGVGRARRARDTSATCSTSTVSPRLVGAARASAQRRAKIGARSHDACVTRPSGARCPTAGKRRL